MGKLYDTAEESDLWSVALLIVVLMYVFLKKDLFSRTVLYLSGALTLMLLITGSQRSIYQRGIAGESALSAWRR